VKLLLDTHIFLWWTSESSRLSPLARDLIGDLAAQAIVEGVTLLNYRQDIRSLSCDDTWLNAMGCVDLDEAIERLPELIIE